MREDKAQGTIKGQQPFFIFHNGVVGAVIVLRVAFGVLIVALFVLRKISVMDALCVDGEAFPQGSVLWQAHQFGIEFFKHLRVNTLAALRVAVFLYFVDEEQGQHFDTLFCVAQFLIQMRLNRPAYLHTLDKFFVNVAYGVFQPYNVSIG